jgi:lipopolysaccharide transport system ATP-binding protein
VNTAAIQVKDLSKHYKIVHVDDRSSTLSEKVMRSLTNPFRRIGRILRGDAAGATDSSETFRALDGVSFDIQHGEVVGVVGRNGAGKSTLLRLLSRITEPTTGTATIRGRVGSLLEVGTGFHPELTGRENIFLNGAILGMRRAEIRERFDEIVAFSEVERFLDTPVKRYSSGMYLRLAFAVAAHVEPHILLVDEVLAVGDADFQKKCLSKMQDASASGRTVVFVSHNMAAVENLCSRALWIDGGKLREDGPVSEVIENYLTSYASGLGDGSDLSGIEEREGGGEIRFTGIQIFNGRGEAGGPTRSGESMTIRLTYEVSETVLEPHFGIDFFTGLGTLLAGPSTWASGIHIPRLEPGEGSVELKIDMLNLLPGRCYLSLWSASVGSKDYDLLDRCTILDVETSDYYGSGRGIEGRWGVLFFPCTWHV